MLYLYLATAFFKEHVVLGVIEAGGNFVTWNTEIVIKYFFVEGYLYLVAALGPDGAVEGFSLA